MAVELSHERFVFSARWHRAALAYVVASVAVATGVGLFAHGRSEYVTVWAATSVLFAGPAAVGARRAARHVPVCELGSWRLWFGGWFLTYVGNGVVYLVAVHGWDALRPVPAVMAVIGIVLFGVGNTQTLQRRSGERALVLDVVDILVWTIAVTGPVALLVGEDVVTSPHSWFTITGGLLVVGLTHGIGIYGVIYARLSPDKRGVVAPLVLFLFVAQLDGAAMIAQGVRDFALPAAALVGLHAVTMGGGVLLPAFAIRQASPGLGRLPPQRQVRKNGPLAGLLLVSVVVIGAEAWWRRDETWVVVTAMGLLAALVLLSAVRQLYLGRETVRLYAEVERAADERRDLLAEVMRYVDTDRHRAAAQLHRQAASLYTAVATFTEVNMAARRVRVDLARQVESAQQILVAMRANVPDHDGLERLVTLTRAYLGNLYGDVRRPALDVSIDDRLTVDWTHEVVVFRIVQMAVHNVWRHAEATSIGLSMTAADGALTVEVRDDGVGFETDIVVPGNGIVTMQTLAAYVDGRVEIESTPGDGTRVCAVVGGGDPTPPPPPEGRPGLRLVSSAGQQRSRR